MRKPPALIIPACSSAVMGVGAKRKSGSHMWSGNWADLLMAPTKSSNVTAVAPLSSKPPTFSNVIGVAADRSNNTENSMVPQS